MNVKEIIKHLVSGQNLSKEQMEFMMEEISLNKVSNAQIGAFLATLAMKGETTDEIFALSQFIYKNALRIGPFEDALDIHGTGGDMAGTFNISSTTIFVVAAGGVTIVKHGNKSSSGRSGAADTLEALGININLEPKQIEKCVKKIGIGFMFAQKFHPKLKPITVPRKEVGIKTIFNKAFVLISPANVKNHFLGITDWELASPFADVLKKQGCKRFMLVHGQDPMDEVSISSPTNIWQYFEGEERQYTVRPEDFGIKSSPLADVQGGAPEKNAEITRRILSNEEVGPKRNIILLNAAASFLIANKVREWKEGIELADEIIKNGKALKKLEEFAELSHSLNLG